jgi:Protein of unknown function (DUF2970)
MSGPEVKEVASPSVQSEGSVKVLRRSASLGSTIKAVGSSFFGVRARSAHEQDVAKLNPLVVIAVGLGMAILLVLTLLTIVRLVLK